MMFRTLRMFCWRKAAAVAALALSCGLPGGTVAGQDLDDALRWYGQGVHQYYTGELEPSIESLTKAIALRESDPRPYYFRGLCYAQMGDSAKAEADFKAGAAQEAEDSGQPAFVNISLVRVQGEDRLKLEEIRKEARFTRRRRIDEQLRIRYERLEEAEKEVLQRAKRPGPRPDEIFGDEPGDALPPKPAADPAPADPST